VAINMTEINAALRKLRMIQLALLAFILVSACVTEVVCGPGNGNWGPRQWLVTGLALYEFSVGLHSRRRLLPLSAELIAKDASNLKGLKRWEAWHVLALVMAASVAYMGLFVRMVLGGTLWQALLFYVPGAILVLLWTPRKPSPSSTPSSPSPLL
jgi:hypothetical protein